MLRGLLRELRYQGCCSMRVFLTGATGYIGSAILRAFVEDGHEVFGLTRRASLPFGRPVRGDLRDSNTYETAAIGADVVIHAAFETPALDRRAIFDFLEIAQHAMIVYTSSAEILGETLGADEDAEAETWRSTHERFVLDAGGAVIRPGVVFGGGRGAISRLFEDSVYPGTGQNRVALVYRGDLADLYLRVAKRRATGIFHGVDGEIQTMREVARAASYAAGRSGVTRSCDELPGPDQIVLNPRAMRLGWRPRHKPFLESARDVYDEWICAPERFLRT